MSVVVRPIMAAHRQVSGPSSAMVRTLGILAAKAGKIVHDRSSMTHLPENKPLTARRSPYHNTHPACNISRTQGRTATCRIQAVRHRSRFRAIKNCSGVSERRAQCPILSAGGAAMHLMMSVTPRPLTCPFSTLSPASHIMARDCVEARWIPLQSLAHWTGLLLSQSCRCDRGR